MNQKRYRKYLKTQTLLMALLIIGLTLLIVLLEQPGVQGILPQVSGDAASNLAASRYGMLAGAGVVGVFYIIRNLLALRNLEWLEKLYVKYTDERDCSIREKSALRALYACMVLFLFALPVTGFYSLTVYWTLYCSFMILLLCYLVANLVYRLRKI